MICQGVSVTYSRVLIKAWLDWFPVALPFKILVAHILISRLRMQGEEYFNVVSILLVFKEVKCCMFYKWICKETAKLIRQGFVSADT